MAETVKKEWITEANGTKVAPKTVLSQVLNNDGTSFEARFINVEQGVGGPVVLKDRANEISGTFDLHGENYISSLKIDNSKVEMSAPALSIHDNAAGDTSTSITMSGMAINEHARNGITLDSEKGVEITSKDDEYNNWGFVKVSASDAVEIKANRSNNTAVGDVVIQANNKISDIAKDISETASNSLEIKAISEYNNKGDVSIEGTNSVSIKSQDISITADSQFSNRGRLDISSSDDLSMEVGGDTGINSVGGISVNSEEGNIGLSTNSGDINITSDASGSSKGKFNVSMGELKLTGSQFSTTTSGAVTISAGGSTTITSADGTTTLRGSDATVESSEGDLSLNGKNDTSITAGNKLGISSEDYIEINADKSIAITGADGDVSIASESGKVQLFTNDEDIVIAPDGSGNVSIAPYSGDINLTTGNGGTAYYNDDEIATVGYVESLPQINAVSITDTRVTLAGRTKDAYLTSMNNVTVQAANGKAELASMAGNTKVSAYGNVSIEGTTGYVNVKGATGISMETPFGLSMTADRGIGIKSNSDGVTIEGAGASVSATGNLLMSGNYIQVTANNKNLTMASNNKNVNIYADNGEINLNAPSVNINGEDISGLTEFIPLIKASDLRLGHWWGEDAWSDNYIKVSEPLPLGEYIFFNNGGYGEIVLMDWSVSASTILTIIYPHNSAKITITSDTRLYFGDGHTTYAEADFEDAIKSINYYKVGCISENVANLKESLNNVISEGSKNILQPTLATSTQSSVTCTNNGDGTYTLNGTNNSGREVVFWILSSITLEAGTYKLVGTPTARQNCSIGGALTSSVGSETGSGKIITVSSGTVASPLGIVVPNGTTVSNLVFKPMLTKDLSASYETFEPYYKSLTELKSDLNPIGTHEFVVVLPNKKYYGSIYYFQVPLMLFDKNKYNISTISACAEIDGTTISDSIQYNEYISSLNFVGLQLGTSSNLNGATIKFTLTCVSK